MIIPEALQQLIQLIEKQGIVQHQQIQLRPRTNLTPGLLQEYKRTYIKVKQESKDQLCRLVFQEGCKIIEVAKLLQIKYATAKTIIFHLRRQRKQRKTIGTRQCGVSELKVNKIQKLKIISMTSDRIITILDHQLTLPAPQLIKFKNVPSSDSLSNMVGSNTL